MHAQTIALSVQDLSKKYDSRFAVSHANFEVPLGSICGFVGPNGAGKTTTIRMLLGLISPTGGTGQILGHSIDDPDEYLKHVGAMIEGPAFYPALSGAENLHVLATLGGFSHERVDQVLATVGLADRAQSKFKTYSLGMKQRLGIAAALLPDPKILILDEPTNGLDPEGIQEVRDLIKRLAEGGTTVFVSSHLLSELELISEHIVMLRKGKVIFAGPMSELLAAQKPLIIVKTSRKSDLKKIVALAKAAGHNAFIKDEEAFIEGPHNWAATLNELAFDEGITLSKLLPTTPNLEETFFEMTGGL